jgi:hypothetical protein
MNVDRRDEQIAIIGPAGVHLIVDCNLLLWTCTLTTLPNSFGLPTLPLRTDFRRAFEHAETLAFNPSIAVEHALSP